MSPPQTFKFVYWSYRKAGSSGRWIPAKVHGCKFQSWHLSALIQVSWGFWIITLFHEIAATRNLTGVLIFSFFSLKWEFILNTEESKYFSHLQNKHNNYSLRIRWTLPVTTLRNVPGPWWLHTAFLLCMCPFSIPMKDNSYPYKQSTLDFSWSAKYCPGLKKGSKSCN